jgi:hypothetical protein
MGVHDTMRISVHGACEYADILADSSHPAKVEGGNQSELILGAQQEGMKARRSSVKNARKADSDLETSSSPQKKQKSSTFSIFNSKQPSADKNPLVSENRLPVRAEELLNALLNEIKNDEQYLHIVEERIAKQRIDYRQ